MLPQTRPRTVLRLNREDQMEYRAIVAVDLGQLHREVNAMLSAGCQLQGGISIAFDDGGEPRHAQALVRAWP